MYRAVGEIETNTVKTPGERVLKIRPLLRSLNPLKVSAFRFWLEETRIKAKAWRNAVMIESNAFEGRDIRHMDWIDVIILSLNVVDSTLFPIDWSSVEEVYNIYFNDIGGGYSTQEDEERPFGFYELAELTHTIPIAGANFVPSDEMDLVYIREELPLVLRMMLMVSGVSDMAGFDLADDAELAVFNTGVDALRDVTAHFLERIERSPELFDMYKAPYRDLPLIVRMALSGTGNIFLDHARYPFAMHGYYGGHTWNEWESLADDYAAAKEDIDRVKYFESYFDEELPTDQYKRRVKTLMSAICGRDDHDARR